MAKQPKAINRAAEMLMEGKTPKEIQEETGCSASTITIAKKRLNEREGDLVAATNETNTSVDEVVDGFISRIKIQPDPAVLTKDNEDVDDDIDYQCPSCEHEWSASKKEQQTACPVCGQEFE